jgi:cell division protein FtsQ
VRRFVTEIRPTGPNDLRFELKGGAEVRWGSAELTAEKVESLQLLIARAPNRDRYDVSAPSAPAVSKR